MHLRPVHVVLAGWIALDVYWIVAARGTRTSKRTESGGRRILYVALLIAGPVLLTPLFRTGPLATRLYERGFVQAWASTAVAIAGIGFAIWARANLGRNWSGRVTLKEGHELVRSGAYRFVRHPIYSGILLGLFGTALLVGEVRGIPALALVIAGLLMKIDLEERWLTEEFGDAYAAYKREVKALIPFVV